MNWTKLRRFLVMSLTIIFFLGPLASTSAPSAQASTMVYTSRTGMYYYASRNDRGLAHAKPILTVTIEKARQMGKKPHGQMPAPKPAAKPKPASKPKPAPKSVQKNGHLVHNDNRYTYKTKAPYSISANMLNVANYNGAHILYVNNNRPNFSSAQLSRKQMYATYYNRDRLGRAYQAEALLGAPMMPTQPRQSLTFDPSGWNTIKLGNGSYLYDRSHLIGYQFTGQNNNPNNLITGTTVLNRNHGMEHYENLVANYLRHNRNNRVYYQVRAIYRGNNRVATGVQMQAKSVGSNAVNFNVYIFNVQDGYNINYATGK